MNEPLKILILEDSEPDVLLICRELEKSGIDFEHRWVETAADYKTAIDKDQWDVILSDYSMGQFTGLDALNIMKERELDYPFIILSGTIGEDIAVAAMHAGAQDYITKGKLGRLAPAIEREVKDAVIRREARESRVALDTANRNWQATFDALENPIMLLSADQRIIQCNKATSSLLNLEADKIIGEHCWEVVHRTDGPIENCPFHQSKEYACRHSIQLTMGDKIFACATDPIFIGDDNNLFDGAIHILTDITDLVVSEERFRSFFENEPSYCYMVSPEGMIIDLNQAAQSVLGYEKNELEGRPISLIYSPESNQKMKDFVKQWEATGRIHNQEMTILTKQGEKRTVLLNASAIMNLAGCIVSSVSVQTDITDLLYAEQRLTQSQKMESIGRLAGGVAHDFNNLLTAIIGNADLARTKLSKADKAYKHINPILEAADRAANLTRQLLIFSRQEKVEPKVIDLTRVTVDFQKILQRILPENIEFKIIHGEQIDSIKADMGQMEQVILNLAVNSRDAMPKGGKLVFEIENIEFGNIHLSETVIVPPGKYVRLSVSDTGAGMDSETISHIFEPFYTTKEKGSGTGLGLSTVYGIIEQSNGHISVYSEIGTGTTFKIYLPAVSDKAEPLSQSSVDSQIPIGTGTILLVEDEEGVREVAETILSTSGYDVLKAENAAEALDLWEEHKDEIDLLLTDVIMPGISGKELADTLISSRSDLKVLFMSGYSTDVISFHEILPGGVELLQKPFTPFELATVVKNIL